LIISITNVGLIGIGGGRCGVGHRKGRRKREEGRSKSKKEEGIIENATC